MCKTLYLIGMLLAPTLLGWAQSGYNPQKAFAPLYPRAAANTWRNANGSPGPDYWQNEANYQVAVTLDTSHLQLSGSVDICYVNQSPSALGEVWLELDQNLDRGDPGNTSGTSKKDAGFRIRQVDRLRQGRAQPLAYQVYGTRMQVKLAVALAPNGDTLHLHILYDYVLQRSGTGGRSGYMDTPHGRIYEVSYWYPRMCVFDDLHGWNTLPFRGGGEFYMDYGNIDYRVTLPAGLLVAGSGALTQPSAVLTDTEIRRLSQARQSEKTVVIRTAPSEQATRRSPNGLLTWHFQMNHTRDVAWAASSAFQWDAAHIPIDGAEGTLAMSYYPPECGGDSSWGRATAYVKDAVEQFSRKWFPYPYPAAISVAGPVGGMEFPGITFDWWDEKGKALYGLVTHEIGHSWFPMIVGSNERRAAWMDEGFNTFIDIYAQQAFHQGEYAPKRDGEYAPGGGNPAEEIVAILTAPHMPPIATLADAIPPSQVHPLEYFKAAFGLVLLREVILGPERFDDAFRAYIHAWAFRHPSPDDFFRAMDTHSGEDLSWFWRGWFLHNWTLDQAVLPPRYVQQDTTQGAWITVENKEALPMPLTATITQSGGKTLTVKLPVEIWQQGGTWTFRVNTQQSITRIALDPQKQLPDIDRSNNLWTGQP